MTLSDAIAERGGITAFARQAGVTHTAVWKWLRKGVSPARAIALEAQFGIPRHVTRPDLWPEREGTGA